MIEEIEQGMILYTQGNKIKHDVAHFLKVHQYARIIGKLEHLEKREQEILEVAAIVHDIACPMCESNLTKEAIEKMKKNVFKTKTGIELLNHIFEL